MSTSPLLTSNSDSWSTPETLLNELRQEFGEFDLDPCATPHNAIAKRYFTFGENGLLQDWRGLVFMNPPYGRNIYQWVFKAYQSSLEGATVICLLPSRTDTQWFHDYVLKGEVRFIRGRLKFSGSKENAPFPSLIVIFRG